LRAISASPTDVQPVLDTIAGRAGQLCGGQHSVVVYLCENGTMHRRASEGARVVGQGTQPLDRNSVSGRAIIEKRAIHVVDLEAERDSYPQTWAAFEEFLRGRGVTPHHTMISVPLIREGNAIGAIMVRRGEVRAFTANEIQLLQTFADQAVIAIENTRLFKEIGEKNRQLADWNRTLEARVAEGIATLERAARLQRFLPRQVADMLMGDGGEESLRTHRRDITVVFLDLRGFTAFTETADPEEVMHVLGEYYAAMGRLVHDHGGTLASYSGDGIMAFFNDPIPMPDAPMRAAAMAIEMQQSFRPISLRWKERGYDLQLGVGIAQGYATLGTIGFEGRWDYGAIGTVCNLASRLCGEAKGGEILASQRVVAALNGRLESESCGELPLKGFSKPVATYKLRAT
jgi:class 3 adenylate cyclase